jgi:hypothetical protein
MDAPQAAIAQPAPETTPGSAKKSSSKTVTDTVIGDRQGCLLCGLRLPSASKKQPLTRRKLARCHTHAGEHEHTIVGYSLVKGIGDGEPIARQVAAVLPPSISQVVQ